MTRHDDLERKNISGVTLQRRERRKRQGMPWLLIFLLLIAGIIWLAPMIIAKTDLRNQIVGWALPDLSLIHI